MKTDFLVSGAASGVGKALFEKFGGIPLVRSNSEEILNPGSSFNVGTIIHCAFRQVHDAGPAELEQIARENLLITEQLLKIPHQKFIYMSSSDVYPKSTGPFDENTELYLSALGPYGKMKVACEELVKNSGTDFLILRPTSMLGRSSRRNNLLRMLEDDPATLTMTEDSSINIVLHQDVVEFVSRVLRLNLSGIFNICSSENVSLGEIAKTFKKSPCWGKTHYSVSRLDNSRARTILPELERTTGQSIGLFFNNNENQKR
jgi:nucleoside-diphosphate-sugar epimerase